MASIGVMTLELRIESAHSLKEKRQVVRSLKDRLRHRHNVAVAEIDYQELWQRGLIAVVTVASSRSLAEKTLRSAEREAITTLGPCLIQTSTDWVE